MSPPGPSRAKRCRTTVTAGHSGDAAVGAPFGDQYIDAPPVISTEPVKRKRLDSTGAHQHHVTPSQPPTTQYQVQPPPPQQQTAASQATTPLLTQQHHHQQQQQQQQQQQMMGMMPVYHRPTYRSDLAKRGYLVRNSLGCGSYSKVIWRTIMTRL